MPAVDEEGGFFWEGTLAGELRIQACDVLRQAPPSPTADVPVVPFHRTGLEARSRARAPSGPSSSPTRRCSSPTPSLAPYNVIVVALDEHPTIRFVGNLVSGPDGALNEIDPNSIRIGEPVEVVFKHFRRADGSEEALPFWVRA